VKLCQTCRLKADYQTARPCLFCNFSLTCMIFKFAACFPHARNFPAPTNFPRKHEPAFSLPVPCLTNYREPP
jgi:hypothetical protein